MTRRALPLSLVAVLAFACRTGPKDGEGTTDTAGLGATDEDGDGYTAAEDCDDGDASVHPGATEICDGVDNDCDDELDEGVLDTFYADADGDGYGGPDAATTGCSAPAGHVATATDCDDTDAAVHPSATERCNGVDDDCDGAVDDADSSVDLSTGGTWYADTDGDGYGDAGADTDACAQPSGTVSDATDCDDTDAAVSPAASEVCNGVDDDCDGAVDDADSSVDLSTGGTWYADTDGDGFGDAGADTTACLQPSGTVSDTSDCDDTDAAVNPDALEVCNGVDDDCDGSADGSDAWWDDAWPYRIPVTVSAASTDVDGPPVGVDIDFRAALDSLGDSGAFDPDTLRVVVQDCALGQPELPSQFVDQARGLWEKADHDDPTGDEAGMVAFVWDEDGDLSSLETLAAGSTVQVALYFGGSATAPGYSAGLSAAADDLDNGLSVALFDDTAGGMLDSLTAVATGTVLTSQTDSCCGNSIYLSSGWAMDPQDDVGALTLTIDGPVLAAVEAAGSRSSGGEGYAYVHTYWMLAGRPELYTKVWQATTSAGTATHSSDVTDGIRPWESRQDALAGVSGATLTVDPLFEYADTWDGSEGLAWAYVQPPAYVVSIDNYDPYLIVRGNDWIPSGSGTPLAVPAGTTYFDHVVQVLLPHTGDLAATEDTLFGLMEQTSASAGAAEAW